MDDEELTENSDDILDDDDSEMPWEMQARERIEGVLNEAEFDEVRGVIYAPTGHDHRYNEVTEGYTSYDELLHTLRELGEEQWHAYVPYENGPVFESTVWGTAERLAEKYGVLEFFERVQEPNDAEELGTAREMVLYRAGLVVEVDLGEINDELIKYLALHPEKMHELEPRKFEELVAELFRHKGYDVVLTPKTRDGGLDMRAFYKSDVGTLLTLIECKRYAPDKRVSVDVVRALHGVRDDQKATNALIVTTSSFTKDAKSFQDRNKHQIELADQASLQKWLNEHKRR